MFKFPYHSNLYERLKAHRNAVISFNLKSGSFTVDLLTGNRIPGTQKIEIQAIVHNAQRPNDAMGQFFEGKDQRSQWVRGRFLVPKVAPEGIKHLSRGRLSLGDFDECDNFTETSSGDFILYTPNTNPYTRGNYGTKFYGVFLSA